MNKKFITVSLLIALILALFSCASAIEVESVNLNGAKTLISGKNTKLEAILNPQNATSKTLSWSSSNAKAAIVNGYGVVSALDVNEDTCVTITATAQSGCFGTHEITIKPRAISVTIEPSNDLTLDLSNEGYLQFTATVSPSSAEQDIEWSVSNGKVAHITDGGLLSAKKKGIVTVRATVVGQNNVMASVRVSITKIASSVTIKGATRLVSGKKAKLGCVVIPKSLKKNAVTWESLTPDIAKVSTSGKVTALDVTSEQVAIIKATAKNNPDACDTHEILIIPKQ